MSDAYQWPENSAKTVSIDATFKASKKATIASSDQMRTNPSEGGLLTSINEVTEVMKWELCQTQSNARISEFLRGLRERHEILEVPLPEQFVADNCCHIVRAILDVFPEAAVGLDVFHCIMRYQAAIINGTKNPYRLAVAQDLRDAILIKGASKEVPAKYWAKEEQEVKLEAAFVKWTRRGGVWSAAAAKVHADQMKHVRKGCLARRCDDIAADGSRIEGTHKGWNSIMRSHASGLETFVALGHDFVLRRNVRIASALKDEPRPFVTQSAYGSHNVRLANHNAKVWNASVETNNSRGYKTQAMLRPELPIVNSGEIFGLVRSADAETYRGLIQLKEEEDDEDDEDKLLRIMDESEVTHEQVSEQTGVDLSMFVSPDTTTTRRRRAAVPPHAEPPSSVSPLPVSSKSAACSAASDTVAMPGPATMTVMAATTMTAVTAMTTPNRPVAQPDATADIPVDPILLAEDAYIRASMQDREKEVFEVEHHGNVVDLTLDEDSAKLEDGVVTLPSDSSSRKRKTTDAEEPGNAIKKLKKKKLKKSPQNAHLFVPGMRLVSQAKRVPLFKTRRPPAAARSTQPAPNAGVLRSSAAPSIPHVSAVPAYAVPCYADVRCAPS
ncbi:hypothetical protein EWM64_g8749, partial [Hericium alpestre]